MSSTVRCVTFSGMIERETLSDAAAAVVADDREAVEAVVVHDLDHVERHRALRVVGVVLAVGRLAAVAVAAQVRHDHRVILARTAARRCAMRRATAGAPWISRSGGPSPPLTTLIVAPEV